MKKLAVWGIILNFLGTLALAEGLVLSNAQINQLSGTYFDYNPFMVSNLVANRNWALFGFTLIAVGFVLQFIDAVRKK